ncbi:unnamed protein product [Agarophyton chilense]
MAFVSSFSGVTVRSATNNRAVCSAAPRRAAKWTMSDEGGKGFGGGEATRDPSPTKIDPNDPKGKQTAIHPAETFAEYQARLKREAQEKKGQ